MTEQKVNAPGISDCYDAATTTETYASSWYLREIISPTGNTDFTFTYAAGSPISHDFITENKYEHVSPTNSIPDCAEAILDNEATVYKIITTIKILNPKYISQITSITGDKIVFNYDNSREDLVNGKRLTSINISNSENTVIKNYNFIYSYFQNGALTASKRLRLDGMYEAKAGPYSFYYHSTSLPQRNSAQIDYWGFYNGKTANTHSIPPAEYKGAGSPISFCSSSSPCNT